MKIVDESIHGKYTPPNPSGPWLNEFTHEYWAGHEDRHSAPNYVTWQMDSMAAPLRYSGRINGQVTTDQTALKQLKEQITKEVFNAS